ncbi:hypothetical protein KAU33_02545 [Candidatus Dependentiae bacterium]|nr:hypothetical protein [Candidatus Dependentiae bacterium]
MEFDDPFNNITRKDRVISIIFVIITTAILSFLFNLEVGISVFIFLIMIISVWIGLGSDSKPEKY